MCDTALEAMGRTVGNCCCCNLNVTNKTHERFAAVFSVQGAKQSEATPRVASSRAQENGVLCVLSLVVAVFEFCSSHFSLN